MSNATIIAMFTAMNAARRSSVSGATPTAGETIFILGFLIAILVVGLWLTFRD